MSAKSVFCIATSRAQADGIVGELKNANFSNNDISVLFPDKDTTRDFAHEKNTKAPEGAVDRRRHRRRHRRRAGMDRRDWRVGHSWRRPVHRRGPDHWPRLSGAAVGAAAGGIAGALIGMGIPELEAKRYEGKVRWLAISSSRFTPRTRRKSRGPRRSSRRAGAQDICTTR